MISQELGIRVCVGASCAACLGLLLVEVVGRRSLHRCTERLGATAEVRPSRRLDSLVIEVEVFVEEVQVVSGLTMLERIDPLLGWVLLDSSNDAVLDTLFVGIEEARIA